jgi:ATP synthase protein I
VADRDADRTHGRFARQVGARERRKLRAREHPGRSIWFGLGMYGLVGWSVTIPTVIGVAVGVWVDATWPSRFSWTLMLLAAGLVVGCWTAWRWVSREQRAIGDAAAAEEDADDRR